MENKKLIRCKACDAEIAVNAKVCPHCGAKNKKPVYKKAWFWVLIAVVLIAAVGGSGEETPEAPTPAVSQPVQAQTTVPGKTLYQVGDTVEASQLRITYLACYTDSSNSQFLQPKEGCRYITCEFEFENLGNSDQSVSYFSFDCYADGISCDSSYFRDDALSATLSAGRKAKGTVTFEVPVDATQIELEYLSNAWTSNRLVFSVIPA